MTLDDFHLDDASASKPNGQPIREVDVLGVGFGPSNLALALAIREHNERHPQRTLKSTFLERQPTFAWHAGMLLEGATMQVAFLKDLVTMRNPTSPYTFVNYLYQQGRLPDFINQKDFFPTRVEYHDYLRWAADHVADLVLYDRDVTSIHPIVHRSGIADRLAVESRQRFTQARAEPIHCRNIVIATGLAPRLPAGMALSHRVWHSSQLLFRAPLLRSADLRSIAIVGSGQSAAEAAAYLHREFPKAQVHCIMQRVGYSASDDTPFVNRVFDPESVDEYYSATPEVRSQILNYHGNTNYSVVDESLITDLYKRQYQESISGPKRLIMRPLTKLLRVEELERDRPILELQSLASATLERLEVDLAILATGYDHMDPRELLGDINNACLHDALGRLQVSRSHELSTTGSVRAGIYLQGGTEHTHGLSSSLLSNVAVRAGEIVKSIQQNMYQN